MSCSRDAVVGSWPGVRSFMLLLVCWRQWSTQSVSVTDPEEGLQGTRRHGCNPSRRVASVPQPWRNGSCGHRLRDQLIGDEAKCVDDSARAGGDRLSGLAAIATAPARQVREAIGVGAESHVGTEQIGE